MKTNRSLLRVAALTGVTAFLFSFAPVSPAAAQTSTRHVATCLAGASEGENSAECTVTVPSGKVFIIESASFGGLIPSSQMLSVRVATKRGSATYYHTVPAGSQVRDASTQSFWSGNISGTFFAESGPVKLLIWRAPGNQHEATVRMTLYGRLEDL